MMYRPSDVYRQLGVSASTLRRWSSDDGFARWLSPSAAGATDEAGTPQARSYTDADVALLARIKAALDAGATVEMLLQHLDLHGDVVVRNSAAHIVSADPPIGAYPPAPQAVAVSHERSVERIVHDFPPEMISLFVDLSSTNREVMTANAEMMAANRDLLQEMLRVQQQLAATQAKLATTQAQLLIELRTRRDDPAPLAALWAWWKEGRK